MPDQSQLETYGLSTQRVAAGRTIFRAGDRPDVAYLIIKGSVGFYVGDKEGKRKQTVTAGAGEIFGEIALLKNTIRTVDAVALSDSTLMVLDNHVLTKRLERTDPFIRFWIEFMSNRLLDLEARLGG